MILLSVIAASRRRGYLSSVMADSPVGFWRLGEASGTDMFDASGNGHHGTYYNTPTFGVTGAVTGDTAITLTAASLERGEVSDRAALDITGALTLEAWVKAASYSVDSRGIISKWIGAGNQRSYVLYMTSAGKLGFLISSTGSFQAAGQLEGTTVIGTSAWRHVVAVFVPGTSMRIYLDGALEAEKTSSVLAAAYSGTAPLRIGSQFDTTTVALHWNGSLDESAVYPTALSAASILAHYNAR